MSAAPTEADVPGSPAPAGRARRFRSTRRIPAVLTALAVLGAAGLFLYDLVAVRTERPGMRWRRELARQLDRHTLAEAAVVTGAALLALLGLVLLVLACTPGLRRVLPMRSPAAGVRAGLGRKGAALLLRDRAMEVSGVQSVRVAVHRRRITVRAASHFRELDDVRADLDAVLRVGREELGLARELPLRVRVVRRAAGKR
ncbi:DUF6286 domain-containing protein [Streptomyces sp. NPDC090022]|uniref:DUF6286 domain-containing protein n=1 Tax=Streptomyces sp. NPDC090022 TaxID=3365920 RepID=UPI0038092ADB